ncbi:MAG TPA: hypothetical protein VMJ10_14800 [Kofleriaceae bacterium]|nr:hypothetical protein [Kofleriaceae bacterium]
MTLARWMMVGCLAIGCGGSHGASGGDAAGSGNDAKELDGTVGGADITGTAVIHHVTETTTIDTPVDLSSHPITAYFETSPGQFASYTAVATTNGGFSIAGVPAGPYAIAIVRSAAEGGTAYIETAQRTIDLSWTEAGRIDGVEPTGATELDGLLSGLEAWQNGDALITTCDNLPGIPIHGTNMVVVDATTFNSSNGPLMVSGTTTIPLIDGTKGDQVWVVQTRAPDYASSEYGRIVKAASSSSIVMEDQIGGTMSATLADVTQTAVTFTWKAEDFASYATALAPDQVYVDQSWGAYAGLDVTRYPVTLFTYDALSAADATPSFSYGDPYPSGWTRTAFASGFAKTDVLPIPTWVVSEPLASLNGSTLQPVVSPATSVMLGTTPAFSGGTGVGLAPKITWSAPALGTPTSYDVVVWTANTTTTIMTKATSVTVPPGVLSAGNQFGFAVRAHVDATRDPEVAPFAIDTTYAYFDVSSAWFTP